MTVIEDRSDYLIPYWRDQSRVRAQLARLFPHHAFEHRLYWEGLDAPVPARPDVIERGDWPPPPDSLIVVLGDLGLLVRAGPAVRRYWVELGQHLAVARCRAAVLTPVAPQCYPDDIRQYWQLVAWERSAGFAPGAMCDAAVERLLTLLSPASRIEPGLLRELRLWSGYDAAVESVFWQHPALASDSSVAATLDARVARERRAKFVGEPEAVQAETLKTIRRWRGGLPPEVWYAEIQGLERSLRERLIDPEEVRQSRAFFAALGHRLRNMGDSAVSEGVAAWFRFVETRLPEGYRDDPELGAHFEALWRLAHADEPQSESVRNYDPARYSGMGPVRRICVSQQESDLCFAWASPDAETVFAGSPVAWIETRNGEVQIESLPADRDPSFWRSGQPPRWADDWGTDEYGHWVIFSVTNSQGKKITQKMRWIEPGEFLMGSPENEPERRRNEGPQHPVTIRQGYWLFDTACTQELWEAVMDENLSKLEGPDHPVETVSWRDCQNFLERLNQRLPGLDLALPSEAQWEYACRAGTTTPFSFGTNITPEQVNYNGNYPYAGGKKGLYRQQTVPVASLPPNQWGLYEMHGNVWEWCQDHWHNNYRGAPTDGSAWLSGKTDALRVLRGGSWNVFARDVRAAYRDLVHPDGRSAYAGFRCAQVRGESSQEGAEPAGPARSRLAERRPEQGPLGGATSTEPTLLRLDTAPPQDRCALPQAPTFHIRTDREHLRFCRLTKPAWASAIGRDRFGLWCEIAVEPKRGGEPVVQRLRWIPPGRFWMGSPEEEQGRYDGEGPRHQVTLRDGYWLFDTPCTQALWEAVMGKNPSRFKGGDRPVEQVSWNDAQDFLKRINGQIPGLALSLPSEARWEYACRAGTETAIYTGDLDSIAWYSGNSKEGTHPVKLKRANSWGLYDMLGNVWEWCQDGMRDYDQDAQINPMGPLSAGADRVLRGGSWFSFARFVRAAYRGLDRPGLRLDDAGFRCAQVRGEPSQPAG